MKPMGIAGVAGPLVGASLEAKGPLAIGRARRLGIYVVGSGLWLSGGLWLLFHYFVQSRGDFAQRPHRLEPWWLTLHGAFAFGAIWVFGLLWGAHVTPGWAGGERRRSGTLVVGFCLWLILSGFLLYYLGHERLRAVTSLLHWSPGLLLPVPFFLHRLRTTPRPIPRSDVGHTRRTRQRRL